jgi:HAD superfamily hydrolase (TIGR01509 family)
VELSALVFDFDGLLLDTETSAFTTAAEVFAAHRVTLDRRWWLSIIGTADHPHWSEVLEAQLGGPLPDRETVLAERIERHRALIAAEAVRPGIVELLDEADAAGVPCAVASSSPRRWVDGHLERLGLRPRFAAVCSRDDVAPGRTKPAPNLFTAACGALGVDPPTAVALEDSAPGVAAALAAGMRVVGVPAGLTAEADLSAAHLVVPTLAGVSLGQLRQLVNP